MTSTVEAQKLHTCTSARTLKVHITSTTGSYVYQILQYVRFFYAQVITNTDPNDWLSAHSTDVALTVVAGRSRHSHCVHAADGAPAE